MLCGFRCLKFKRQTMERLRGTHRIIILIIISHLLTNVWCGGSSSTISIYQSTSSVPPLAESFSEGACIIPQTARQLDPKWLVRQSTFYVPIASQFTYRLYAETFLSRAGVSEQDVRSMCLTMDFFPDGPGVNVTNTGYDLREFKLTCPVIWRGQFTCLPIGGSPGTNVGRARSTDNYVVSVDNQSYMLVVRCVDGFFRDYMLLTTRPVVSPELYHTVMSTIKDLGFDEKKLQMVTYDSCLRTDRFVTAVNVHHHHNHHHHHHAEGGRRVEESITIKAGGADGLSVVQGGRPIPSNQLRPSFGTTSGGSRRISFGGGGIPISGSIVSSGGGGGGQGRGRGRGGGGGGKVEELEAFYAIIP